MSTDDGTMTYDYSQCENIYEDLVKDQATIDAQMASLENTISHLMLTWSGPSATAAQSIHGTWMTAGGNMSNDLKTAASCLTEMADNMKRTDNAAAARIAGIGR